MKIEERVLPRPRRQRRTQIMPEPRPGEQPGHLDIDAVSAYVDCDFEIAELTILERHVHACPFCEREVLEIRATVLLLNTLPQYEPRRSFCLGQEHARAHRRRDRHQQQNSAAYLPGANPLTLPASTPPDPVTAPAYARWMPALQVATLVTGVLLLLVTVGDLSGMLGSQPAPMQLAAPIAPDAAPAPPPAAMPQEQEQDQKQASEAFPLLTATAAVAAAAPAPAPTAEPQEAAGFAQGGTNAADDASDQMSESDDAPRTAARAIPTSAAAAAVTQAIPTPGVENPAVSTDATGSDNAGGGSGRPSLVRIAQFALAALLLWLIVSMAGVRWIRQLR